MHKSYSIIGIIILWLFIIGLFAYVIYNYLKWQYQRKKNTLSNAQFTLFGIEQVGEILLYFISPFIGGVPVLLESTVQNRFSNLHDWRVKLSTYQYNARLDRYLPWNGQIIKKLDIIYDDHFYLLKLDEPVAFDEYETDYVLVSKMKDYGDYGDGLNYIMMLFLIPKGSLINEDVKSKAGLDDLGYVVMTLEPLKAPVETKA